MSETPINERRRERRVPVDIWIEAEDGDELYFHRADNLSAGGAYFAKTIPEKLGRVVQLRFSLPGDAGDVSCRGEIVSSQEFAMGVKFLDLPAEEKLRIEEALTRIAEPG